ncbi:MAG TPA: hypothetical protein VMX38_08550 [Verrucomicrobiae bacterium]|jgi:hypothetical protein|nr:hypothetical protein [Verrucomicrobiae bacterium]
MPNTPNINIQNGDVDGTLELGKPFYWYNPTSVALKIESCGTWCTSDSYSLPAGPSYTLAQIQDDPNTYGLGWLDSAAWQGTGQPHVTSSTPGSGANTPNINIQTGMVTGSLQSGQTFYWYNPTQGHVDLNACGVWAADDDYGLDSGYTAAAMRVNPYEGTFGWTEDPNQWNAPGLPHILNPPTPTPLERDKQKEVA